MPSVGDTAQVTEPAPPEVVTGGVAGWPDVAPTGGAMARRRSPLRRGVRAVASLWFFAALVALWWVLSADSTSPYFPPLQRILERLDELWIEGDARRHLLPSLKNFGYGFGIAAVVGITVGALLWSVRRLRDAASPILYFLYVMPAPALLPAAIALFGIGIQMKVAIIAFAAVWPTLLNTLDGMLGVDPVKMDTARALGMSRSRTLATVVLRAASPQIAAGLRNSLQVAIILMVVSEMVASTSGIGYFILVSQQSFAITDMWTGIVVLALLGSFLNLLFVTVERRVLAWHYGARASEEKG